MKRPWFKLGPVDESFFEDAPFVMRKSFDTAVPAADVWAELTGVHPLAWCRIIGPKGINWTSEPPYGVGSTRTVSSLKGASVFREHFFVWEEGKRKSFYVVEASGPLFKRFAEDYVVEPLTDTTSRFTWTIAAEPKLPGALANPLNKRLLGTLFADTRKHYASA
ncbi:MAG: SRPBCC family protein [Solirubrobacterales bacterium]